MIAKDRSENDVFGLSVSISDNYAVIGAYGDDDNGEGSGSTYIFKRENEMWNQHQKLTASDGAAGDYFGYSVAISDGYIIVGAFRDDDKRINAGAAYIYTNFRDEELNYSEISVTPSAYDFGETETNTTLETTLTISNTGTGDLSLDTITITGTDASDFTITTDNCSGQTLSPEAECTVTVAFSPTSP